MFGKSLFLHFVLRQLAIRGLWANIVGGQSSYYADLMLHSGHCDHSLMLLSLQCYYSIPRSHEDSQRVVCCWGFVALFGTN